MSTKERAKVWTAASVVLIVLGGILAPVAVTSFWARGLLTSSDLFVSTFAPLADDAEVQSFLVDELSETVTAGLDLPALTSEVVDGIVSLGMGAQATEALRVLQGAAAEAIEGVIHSSIDRFVKSDAFAEVWSESLRLTHTGVVTILNGGDDQSLLVTEGTSLGINVRPVLERLKTALGLEGLSFMTDLPVTNSVIVVTTTDALPAAQSGYRIAVAIGLWMPILAVLLLAAGVAVAPRRLIALRWAAIAVTISTLMLVALEAAGRWVFVTVIPPAQLPDAVATTLYDNVLRGVSDLTTVVLVVAVLTALGAWLCGPGRRPMAIRKWVSTIFTRPAPSDAIQ